MTTWGLFFTTLLDADAVDGIKVADFYCGDPPCRCSLNINNDKEELTADCTAKDLYSLPAFTKSIARRLKDVVMTGNPYCALTDPSSENVPYTVTCFKADIPPVNTLGMYKISSKLWLIFNRTDYFLNG
jgi:hypothetical protein